MGAREVEVMRPSHSREDFDRGWSTCLRIFREGWHLNGPVRGEGRADRRFVFLPSSGACKQSTNQSIDAVKGRLPGGDLESKQPSI